jgi:phosphopantetheine adenylyltransferase
VTGKSKHKKLLKPKLKPTLHNAFAILSQPDDPTNYKMSAPTLKMDDDKTILPPDPREHSRQQKIARHQHIKQTLRRLHDSDNLFLDDSITLAEDERTSLAKADKTNKKCMAINAAHTKRGTTSIGLANVDAMLPTVWDLHSTARLKRSTRTSMSALPHTPSW